jgi:hypothetical protein
MKRLHSYFLYVWFPTKEKRNDFGVKYLESSRSTKTTGPKCSLPSPIHGHMALKPYNERSGSALFYSSTKQKIEQLCSAYQTHNEMAPFSKIGMETLHSS